MLEIFDSSPRRRHIDCIDARVRKCEMKEILVYGLYVVNGIDSGVVG
jgi:hypothetical protein